MTATPTTPVPAIPRPPPRSSPIPPPHHHPLPESTLLKPTPDDHRETCIIARHAGRHRPHPGLAASPPGPSDSMRRWDREPLHTRPVRSRAMPASAVIARGSLRGSLMGVEIFLDLAGGGCFLGEVGMGGFEAWELSWLFCVVDSGDEMRLLVLLVCEGFQWCLSIQSTDLPALPFVIPFQP